MPWSSQGLCCSDTAGSHDCSVVASATPTGAPPRGRPPEQSPKSPAPSKGWAHRWSGGCVLNKGTEQLAPAPPHRGQLFGMGPKCPSTALLTSPGAEKTSQPGSYSFPHHDNNYSLVTTQCPEGAFTPLRSGRLTQPPQGTDTINFISEERGLAPAHSQGVVKPGLKAQRRVEWGCAFEQRRPLVCSPQKGPPLGSNPSFATSWLCVFGHTCLCTLVMGEAGLQSPSHRATGWTSLRY